MTYMFFGFEILVGVFVGVLFATIVVMIMNIRTTSQVNKMTFPAYEYAMKKAEHDAEGLIADARKNARAIITDAEKAGHDTIAGYTNQATEIHEKYKEAIAAQSEHIVSTLHDASNAQGQALTSAITSAESAIAAEQQKVADSADRTQSALEKTAEHTEHQVQQSLQTLQSTVVQAGKDIKKQLQGAETAGEQKLAAHIDSMQEAADAHLATYEASRTKLIDAHIEQLVDSVVAQVLHTQLPVSEHASLARAALEEAKAKHII